MHISIEMADTKGAKYGVVHKAGCRDMRDEMPLGEASTMAELQAVTDDAVCWADDDSYEYATAPCVRLP